MSGKDLRPLGNALFRSTAGLDDSVSELRCGPGRPPAGYFDVDGGTPVLRDRRQTGPAPDVLCEVLVERKGDLPLPLDVQLTFADGTQLRRDVPPGEVWARILTERPLPGGRVTRADDHPGARPAMDTSPINDARSLEATPAPALGVSGWFLYAAQLLAAAVGSLL